MKKCLVCSSDFKPFSNQHKYCEDICRDIIYTYNRLVRLTDKKGLPLTITFKGKRLK